MGKKRVMSSEAASLLNRSGHRNEKDFASAIDGRVQLATHTDKKDVLDNRDRAHSVKAGKWWQVFLYSEDRLRTNTIFQGIGNVADIMLDCIGVYPEKYEECKKNRYAVKQALRPHMRNLLKELEKPSIFAAFLDKSLSTEDMQIFCQFSTDQPQLRQRTSISIFSTSRMWS